LAAHGFEDVKKFALLEKQMNLFNRKYNEFYYWQHIRYTVFVSLFGTRYENTKAEKELKKRSLFESVYILLRAIYENLKLFFHLLKKRKYELVFIREPVSSDKFFDVWEFPDDINVVNYRIVLYTKDHKPGDLYLTWPRMKTAFKRRLYKKFEINKKDEVEKAFLIELVNTMIKEFGQCISADEMEQMIYDYKIEDECYSQLYYKIFRSTGCKAIAFVCYYSNELFPAQRIAKELGIKTIEFQHGVINNHIEYWFEDTRGEHNYMPDYILTFGEIHNSWIKLPKGEKAVSVGYPFQEKCIGELKDVVPNEKEIIIYPESNPVFEDVVNSFVSSITKLGYHVVMKMHPQEAVNVEIWYPILSKNTNIEIVTSQKEGIYYWLKRAKHHVMASTTVGLEAVSMEHVNVCIATMIPHDMVKCLLDWNIARGFSSADELVELVLNPIDMKTDEAEAARSILWEKKSAKNMTNFFKALSANEWKSE